MSKPRMCKSCRWLHNRAEPCWSCSRWGRGKTDYYVSAEETLKEYLERKEQENMEKEKTFENLSTDELITRYKLCMNDDCEACPGRFIDDCASKLSKTIINRLKQLKQELIDEQKDTSSTAGGDTPHQSPAVTASPQEGEAFNLPSRYCDCEKSKLNEFCENFKQRLLAAYHNEPDNVPRVPLIDVEDLDKADDTVRRCAEYVAEKHLQMDDEPPGKHKTQVICISGKAQHGKDTTAQFIKEYLEGHGKSVLIMHYSDLLKFIVRTYFGWNGEKDEDGRALLQYVGTDRIRSQSPDYWTDFAVGLIQMFPDEWDYVILADCRFPNEVECFKNTEFDTFHLRVIRAPFVSPLTLEQQMHPSETALDGVKADDYLLNTGTLEEYRAKVHRMLAYRDAFNGEV